MAAVDPRTKQQQYESKTAATTTTTTTATASSSLPLSSTSMAKFVVGSLNQGVATLVDEKHQTVEFPMYLLPQDIYIGCVVELACAIRPQHQMERLNKLKHAFAEIKALVSSNELKSYRRRRRKSSRRRRASDARPNIPPHGGKHQPPKQT